MPIVKRRRRGFAAQLGAAAMPVVKRRRGVLCGATSSGGCADSQLAAGDALRRLLAAAAMGGGYADSQAAAIPIVKRQRGALCGVH